MLADNFYPPVHRWESKEVEIPQNTQNPFSMSSSLTSATFIFLPSSFCSRGEEGLYGLITFLGRNIRCARGKPRGFIYSQAGTGLEKSILAGGDRASSRVVR